LLRSKNLNLKNNLRPLLESESGSNDPVAFIMTVTLITIVKSGDEPDYVAVASDVVVKLVMGGTAGFFIGRFLVWAINKLNIDNAALYPIAILSGCLIIYATAFFVNGNSYLAVYVGGLVIGNSQFVHKRATINFFDGLTWLCQLIMFLIPFPENTLVVMVKRDGKYFVPKGRTELLSGDHLLLITDNKDILIQTLNSVGIAYNNVKADKVESKLLPI
ncbi:MAG: cation:proton antiporter, partial [Bacteroidales bacterium]|nr:cation:proton antiporter [Bacteroidales bacterium]